MAHELPVKDQGVKQGHIIVEQDEVDGLHVERVLCLAKPARFPQRASEVIAPAGGLPAVRRTTTVNEAGGRRTSEH